MVWLTDERRVALFSAGTIVRDLHHRESLTHYKQDKFYAFLTHGLDQFSNLRSVLSMKNFGFIGIKVRHNILNGFTQDWNLFK